MITRLPRKHAIAARRVLLAVVASVVASALSTTVQAALPIPQRVNLPPLADKGVADSIPALLYRPPQAAANARLPLVIGLHGCGGLYSSRKGQEGELSERFTAWTELLLADGYAVLWLDSFSSRGRREICTTAMGERTITAATRRRDALGALAYAAALPDVDRSRIVLVGWSHGASTTLATINGQNPTVAAFRARPDAPPFFRAAVAFYPGCAAPLRAGSDWRPAAITAIHIGADDDWTPAAPCVALGDAMRSAGQPLTVRVYPDSYHGFDAPSGRVAVRHDVPNGVNPGKGVTNGPNPAARVAAIANVRAFLRDLLKPAADTAPTK